MSAPYKALVLITQGDEGNRHTTHLKVELTHSDPNELIKRVKKHLSVVEENGEDS